MQQKLRKCSVAAIISLQMTSKAFLLHNLIPLRIRPKEVKQTKISHKKVMVLMILKTTLKPKTKTKTQTNRFHLLMKKSQRLNQRRHSKKINHLQHQRRLLKSQQQPQTATSHPPQQTPTRAPLQLSLQTQLIRHQKTPPVQESSKLIPNERERRPNFSKCTFTTITSIYLVTLLHKYRRANMF